MILGDKSCWTRQDVASLSARVAESSAGLELLSIVTEWQVSVCLLWPNSTESAHAAKTNYGAWILRTAASLSVVAGQQAAELCAEHCAAGGTQLTTVAAAVTFCQCQQGALT